MKWNGTSSEQTEQQVRKGMYFWGIIKIYVLTQEQEHDYKINYNK